MWYFHDFDDRIIQNLLIIIGISIIDKYTTYVIKTVIVKTIFTGHEMA